MRVRIGLLGSLPSRWGTRHPRLVACVSCTGFAAAVSWMLWRDVRGVGGIDVLAYWQAGRHALHGATLYGGAVGSRGAYLYPPVFAELLCVPSLLPFPVFAWLWRAIEVLCLRSIVGSWRAVGIALLVYPLTTTEIEAGNVHLVVAASLASLVRGDARSVLPVGLVTKFASLAALPLVLARHRRAAIFSALVTGGVYGSSILLAPADWRAFLRMLESARTPAGALAPVELLAPLSAVPIAWRLAAAMLFALLALRYRRLVVIAVLFAFPVLWVNSLSVLTALVARPTRSTNQDALPRPDVGQAGRHDQTASAR